MGINPNEQDDAEAVAAHAKSFGLTYPVLKDADGKLAAKLNVQRIPEAFVLDGQRARLSAAALETLAIIAYKQPISRLQIASIRGVDPDAVLRTLQGRGYVEQRGRDDGPGQAVLWGTTPLFLEKLGINSVDELPPLAEFVPDAEIVEALEATLRITPVEVDGGGVDSAPNSDE